MTAIRSPARADAVAVSLALARRVLAAVTGLAPAALVVSRTCGRCGHPTHGRPRLVPEVVHFSVSRSERWAAVAVAPVPVGVDVEDADRPVTAADLGPALGAEERRWAAGRSGRELLGLWVLKEAAGKATGAGIVDADRLAVVAGVADDLAGWRAGDDPAGGCWSATLVDPPGVDGAVVAVAVAGRPRPVVPLPAP